MSGQRDVLVAAAIMKPIDARGATMVRLSVEDADDHGAYASVELSAEVP